MGAANTGRTATATATGRGIPRPVPQSKGTSVFRQVPRRTRRAYAMRSVLDSAGMRLRRVHRQALKEGKALGSQATPDAFHAMRKTCKKLRYLLEEFGGLYARREVNRLTKTLKQLQDQLGGIQDLWVQHEILDTIRAEMRGPEGRYAPETLDAMDRLANDMLERQRAGCKAFHGCFSTFASGPVKSGFRCLYEPNRPTC